MERLPSWVRRLKLRHLEIFVTLVESGSVSATAAALHVTQPALSKWLRELEADVGEPLFHRGRRLALTTAGEVVLAYARRTLGDTQRVGEELEALRAGTAGRIRLGVLRPAAALLLPRAILRLQAQAPDVQLTIVEDTMDNLLPRLVRHELDVVLGRLEAPALEAGLLHEALYDEPVCVVAGPGHPLAQRRKVSWPEVARYPWIVPLPGTPMRARLDEELADAGVALPRTAVESASMLTNEGLLAHSTMLTVLSRQLALQYAARRQMAIVPVAMRRQLGPVGMVWTDANPMAVLTRFLDCVRAEAAQAPPRARGVAGAAATPRSPAAPAAARGRTPRGTATPRARRSARA